VTGRLTFSLPGSWQEEQYADGGAALFEGDEHAAAWWRFW